MHRAALLPLLLVSAFAACGDDAQTTPTTGSSGAGGAGGNTATTTSSTGQGGGATTSSGTGGGGTSCLEIWSDGTIEPDATGPNTQIHGSSAFDGELVWAAWSRPDGGSLFDIYVTAFACDGSQVVAPFEITQAADNELNPTLAVSGDRLLVAWTSDNGGSPNNLDIRYRVIGLDGTPLTDVIELAATRAGVAVVGNAMSPSLAAINGGWLLAGQWGHADATAFQAFVVELDANGAVQGDASDVELDTVNGQTEVSLAVDGSDTLVAWQEDSTSSSAPSAWSAVLGNAPVELADPGARPHVGAGPWYVWDDESGAVGVQPPGVAAKALSLAGQVHSAKIGVVGDQATLMWLKVESGISNSVHLAPLAADGTIGTNVSLASTTVPSVYPLDLTMVDATHAVVVYQDGTTPDFRLKADFITVPR